MCPPESRSAAPAELKARLRNHESVQRSAVRVCALIAATAFLQQLAVAGELTCAHADIRPDYPVVNAPPKVEVIHGATRAIALTGAHCFAEPQNRSTWITVTAVARTAFDRKALLDRFGAISQLRAAWYWSTSDQVWRPLVSAAYAIESAREVRPRADYSAADLAAGTPLYYSVTDTRSDLAINYSMQLTAGPASHIVLDTINIDPVRKWGVTLYGPRSIRTLYFLDELSPGVWSYYSITRAVPATFLANGHDKSFINRAVALYRHYVGLAATRDPPPAR